MTKKTVSSNPAEATPAFSVDAEEVQTYPVRLVGEMYNIRPLKSSYMMSIASKSKHLQDKDGSEAADALMKMINKWVDAAFEKDDAKAVKKRLDDPTDPIDIQHIVQMINMLAEHLAGGARPTTSSSGS